nr:hypothetical protein [Tanacetum cinerariifolium]
MIGIQLVSGIYNFMEVDENDRYSIELKSQVLIISTSSLKSLFTRSPRCLDQISKLSLETAQLLIFELQLHSLSSFVLDEADQMIDDGHIMNNYNQLLTQFAQCLRVQNLQYIAELEKNVYALQAEGSEVCAKVEYLNQQRRLKNLAQEQLIKYSKFLHMLSPTFTTYN